MSQTSRLTMVQMINLVAHDQLELSLNDKAHFLSNMGELSFATSSGRQRVEIALQEMPGIRVDEALQLGPRLINDKGGAFAGTGYDTAVTTIFCV